MDDKILADWNGLAIAALARAGRIFDRGEWIDAADRAARFVLRQMTDDQGRLWHTYRAGKARIAGFLDDYANLVDGLIALHRATDDSRWLRAARILTDVQVDLFADPDGGFFFVAARPRDAQATRPSAGGAPHAAENAEPSPDERAPLVRFVEGTPVLAFVKPVYDSVVPAGNGTTVRNLLALARLTGEPQYREVAEKTLRAFSPQLSESPTGVANLLLALDEFLADGPADGGVARGPDDVAASAAGAGDRDAVRPVAETSQPRSPSGDREGQSLPQFVPAAIAPDPDAHAAGGAASGASRPAGADKPRVTAELYLPADALPAGRLCPFVVHIRVADGWHINANPARPEFLKPTRLTVTSELGTQLESVQYPEGRPLQIEGIDRPVHVYSGHVMIRGMLRVPESPGKTEALSVLVHYQACNDARCLRPSRLELTARLPVKDVRELRLHNQPLFQPPETSD